MDSAPPDIQPLLPAQAAPPPFLFAEMQEEENNPHRPGIVFTGERLQRYRPDVYDAVVKSLGQGMGVTEIARRYRVHHRTVQAVSIREGTTIDAMRRELGARALGLAGIAMEKLEERIVSGSAKAGELTLAIGVLVDKGQVLTGGVTHRTESVQAVKVVDALGDALAALPTIEVESVEDVPGTGIAGGNLPPMPAAPDADPAALEHQTGDFKTPVSQSKMSQVADIVADSDQMTEDSGSDQDRGGGGSEFDGGYHVAIGKDDQKIFSNALPPDGDR